MSATIGPSRHGLAALWRTIWKPAAEGGNQLVAVALVVGAGAGFAAVAFRWMISAATVFFSGHVD